ncbi:MAG: preprotein translocase subunit SecE [Candidatus Lightella neohaematopini]|nr:preprotein translocase subunit SecE [Candidatus Lightella neohaematopini]
MFIKINIVNFLRKHVKKLLITTLLVLIIFMISSYYSNLCVTFITIITSIMILYFLRKNNIIKMIIQSYKELKQVSWPNYKDAINITIIITVVTIIMSLIIWGLDTLLINIISFITKLKI